MRDYEILDADIFEYTGLTSASVEEMSDFVNEFGRLVGFSGLLKAGDRLSEKDQETMGRLLASDEGERAQAFLALNGISLEEVISEEVIRVKRLIIEAPNKPESIDELLIAAKSHLPFEVLELLGTSMMSAIQEIQEYIDSLPFSDEQKSRLAHTVEENASQKTEEHIRSLIPEDIGAEVDDLMDSDREGEALSLLLKHGIDFIKLSTDEAQWQLSELKKQFAFLDQD